MKTLYNDEALECVNFISRVSDKEDIQTKYIKTEKEGVILNIIYNDGTDDLHKKDEQGRVLKTINLCLPYIVEKDEDEEGEYINIYLNSWTEKLNISEDDYFEIIDNIEIAVLDNFRKE